MASSLAPQHAIQPTTSGPSSSLRQSDWQAAAGSGSRAAHANGNGVSQAHVAYDTALLQPASSSGTAASHDSGSGGAVNELGELYAALVEGDEPYESDEVQQQQQQQQQAERRLDHAAAPSMPATSVFSVVNSTRQHRPAAGPHAVSGQAPGAATQQQQPTGPVSEGASASALHGSMAGRRLVNTVTLSPAKQGPGQHNTASNHVHDPSRAVNQRPANAQPTEHHHQQQQQQQQQQAAHASTSGPSIVREVRHTDGKVERHLSDGTRVVVFANGTTKTTDPSDSSSIRFANGNIKRAVSGGIVEYFYAEVDTWQTSYASGLEVYHFPSGQTEGHHPDGVKEIVFPDGAVRRVLPDGWVQRCAGCAAPAGCQPLSCRQAEL